MPLIATSVFPVLTLTVLVCMCFQSFEYGDDGDEDLQASSPVDGISPPDGAELARSSAAAYTYPNGSSGTMHTLEPLNVPGIIQTGTSKPALDMLALPPISCRGISKLHEATASSLQLELDAACDGALAQPVFQMNSDDFCSSFLDDFYNKNQSQEGQPSPGGASVHSPAGELGLFPSDSSTLKVFISDNDAMVGFLHGDMDRYEQTKDAVAQKVAPLSSSSVNFYGQCIAGYPSLVYLAAAMNAYDRLRELLFKIVDVHLPANPLHCGRDFVEEIQVGSAGTEILTPLKALATSCADHVALRLPLVDPLAWTFVGSVMLVVHPCPERAGVCYALSQPVSRRHTSESSSTEHDPVASPLCPSSPMWPVSLPR